MRIINKYNLALERRPIITKSLTAIIIFGIGDYLCQEMENRILKIGDKINYTRIIKQASFGIIVAPYLHLQFCIIIPKFFPERGKYSFIKSLVYAITISDSLFNYSFFAYMSMANGKTFTQALQSAEVLDKFIPVQIANMQVWPFLTGFNFYFVPMMYRVLFDNFFCIFWNIYLSYVENNKKNDI
jgi:protein Mpv17